MRGHDVAYLFASSLEPFHSRSSSSHSRSLREKSLARKTRRARNKAARGRSSPDFELYLLLAHETGHRCSAVARLRWSDLDPKKRLVTWRPENDKTGREHTVPLSAAAVAASKAATSARLGLPMVGCSRHRRIQTSQFVVTCCATDGSGWKRRPSSIASPGRGWHSLGGELPPRCATPSSGGLNGREW